VQAAPPFVTDDPGTAEFGHYDLYIDTQYAHRSGDERGVLPGTQLNYGATEHLELLTF
jgi:hypothetical protein